MKKEELSLSYLSHAIKYLHLAELVFIEMKNQGNNWLLTSDKPIDDDNYNNLTKWSDFNIIFPALFIFYHGMELSIKGLLILSKQGIPKIHKFSVIFSELKKQKSIYEETVNIIEKYVDINLLKKTPIGTWITDNNLNIDNLYERLRYPTWGNSDTKITNDLALKYKGEEIIPFVHEIAFDIDKLRRLIVKQYGDNQ